MYPLNHWREFPDQTGKIGKEYWILLNDKGFDKFKDKVYDRIGSVYKEILAVRLEQSMHTGSHILNYV